eukprot:TRINITY_DN4562_c0_g6_i2.p1 TRINITY_DN4562_c0_g6~~TRINITY_DN4562_c0_g6_i2.p1  ORF type:complete len:219 (+),score=92.69 TRINITY_DN4562_c0_g6_i2:59-715(+)
MAQQIEKIEESYSSLLNLLSMLQKDLKVFGYNKVLEKQLQQIEAAFEKKKTEAIKDDKKTISALQNAVDVTETILKKYQVFSDWYDPVMTEKIGKGKKKTNKQKIVDLLMAFQRQISIFQLIVVCGAQDTKSKAKDVLWVDDHPENNQQEIGFLEDQKITVTTEKSTKKALAFLEKFLSSTPSPHSSNFRIITDLYRDDEREEAEKRKEGEGEGEGKR